VVNDMQIIIRIIIPTLIPIFLGLLLSNIDKHNGDEISKNLTKEYIVIHLPKVYLWVGCLDISLFTFWFFLMTIYPNDTADIWVWLLFCIFALLGVVIVVETQIWRIQIFRHENYFIYRTMFFKTYKIQYKECKYYKFSINTLILKTNNKTFRIDNKATNLEFLLAMLTQNKVKENQ
jgi:hypothetical protein